MLSKNKIKFLNSLSLRKYRELNGMFIAEGEKIAGEVLTSRAYLPFLEELYATKEFYESNSSYLQIFEKLNYTIVSDQELKKISFLKTPNKVVLLLKIPNFEPDILSVKNSLSLVFEDIRDPGNLGTIIRTASWFNIHDIFCSPDSVDLYNPKVIQSTMGAFCRVKLHYKPLNELLDHYHNDFGTKIAGASLDGNKLHEADLPKKNFMIVFGNESRGISPEIKKHITTEIKIPSFYSGKDKTDSLNIASAAAIFCWEFMRRKNFTQNENLA